jgi:hypothetical protein
LAFEYDVKVVVPLLMVCFDKLNLVVGTSAIATIYVARSELEENLFGVEALIEESFRALVVGNYLYLRGFIFLHLHV